MGNSTIKLKQVFDTIAGKGIPDPRNNAGGYGDNTALDLANQCLADIITERFNWKWNRADATPFATNSWQQDYPQLTQPAGPIGWGEDCTIVDINNTALPKPLWPLSWRRGLSRVNLSEWRMKNICWMYNKDLYIGEWPGPGVTYYPLITKGPQKQNPLMSMTDGNGNILIVKSLGIPLSPGNIISIDIVAGHCTLGFNTSQPAPTWPAGTLLLLNGLTTVPALNGFTAKTIDQAAFGAAHFLVDLPDHNSAAETGEATPQVPPGTTGTTSTLAAPQLPANSPEGTTVVDGTVQWVCVSPNGQGFRLDVLPSATGPAFLVLPYYQLETPTFADFQQTLDPMPDSFSRHFYRDLEAECLMASPNPADRPRGEEAKRWALKALADAVKQGDKEMNTYGLIPATSVVEDVWDRQSGPYSANQPV